jgi:hypothetical protein
LLELVDDAATACIDAALHQVGFAPAVMFLRPSE